MPNLYNGLNFQQAFASSGFGFQQQGSLFNHQHFPSNQSPFPNNHNFQLASFLMPFFNQYPNQQTIGSFPINTPGVENGQGSNNGQLPVTEQQHIIPNIPQTTNLSASNNSTYKPQAPQSTPNPNVNVETTEDPTSNFDIRLEKDKTNGTNDSLPTIETTSRRPIEGLPTSDEDNNEGGVLDDKINPTVLKTLVG